MTEKQAERIIELLESFYPHFWYISLATVSIAALLVVRMLAGK